MDSGKESFTTLVYVERWARDISNYSTDPHQGQGKSNISFDLHLVHSGGPKHFPEGFKNLLRKGEG